MPHITARTPYFPTEDREKVRQALLNIFPGSDIEEGDQEMVARTGSGERLREIILESHIRDTARAVMLCALRGNGTTFMLNKQVASVGKVSFLDGPVALGGIEVTVEDEDIAGTIDFLAESTVEVKQ